MVDILIRNISDEDYRALGLRAAEHNRSTKAEIWTILKDAVRPNEEIKLGSALAALGRKYNITELNIERDEPPTELILIEDSVRPTEQVKIGSALAAFGRRHNIVEINIKRD